MDLPGWTRLPGTSPISMVSMSFGGKMRGKQRGEHKREL
jgi:hypothetical protein